MVVCLRFTSGNPVIEKENESVNDFITIEAI